jgi:hypothetical protein
MLLNKPWVKDAKVTHDWGNNMITIQGNGTIKTIKMTKHLGTNLKKPKVLICFDYQNGITYEEKKDESTLRSPFLGVTLPIFLASL